MLEAVRALWSSGRRGRLGPGARLVLLSYALFLLAVNLSNVYVTIFLFRLGQSLALVAWYHIVQYVAIVAGFLVAGRWAERRDRTLALRTGIVLHAVFYLAILLLGRRAVDAVVPLGVLLGLGAGFYWLGNHTLTFDLTEDDNRDHFNGIFTALGSLVVMVAPFAAGVVIQAWPGFRGYRIVFIASLALFAASVASSLLLRTKASDGIFELRQALGAGDNPAWRRILWINAWTGLRNGLYLFAVGLAVFMVARSELAVGVFSLGTGAVTAVLSWAAGARIHPGRRRAAMGVGLLATTVSPFVLGLRFDLLGILLFGLVEAAFAPLFSIPFGSVSYQAIERDPRAMTRRIEYMVAREIFLNAGRVTGVGGFLALAGWLPAEVALRVAVIVLGVLPLVSWLSIRRLPD